MKALIQRVQGHTEVECRLDGADHSTDYFKGPGLVVLLGWLQSDLTDDLDRREQWIVSRVSGLRVFPDAEGRMNLSLADYMRDAKVPGGGILWVPQFTLAAKLESGFRPSFTAAMEPGAARMRFESLRAKLSKETPPYKQIFGEFGAEMELSFTNWGPVTIPLEL